MFSTSPREETIWDLVDHCVAPSVLGVADQVSLIFLVNFVYNMITRFGRLSERTFHFISMVLGLYLMHHVVLQKAVILHVMLLLMGYLTLYVSHKIKQWLLAVVRLNTIYIMEIICVFFLIYGEFYYPDNTLWLRSRGIAMITVMKIISLAGDINRGVPMPSLLKFFGYLCCPANSIFGPWIPYVDYVKQRETFCRLNCKWIIKLLKTTMLALIFLTISNCFGEYFVKDNGFKWFVAYRKALCFRSSHYLVSYLSEAVMILAGYNQLVNDAQGRWEYTIIRPLDVEFPRSLANVVISWNVATHRFLKLHVYIIYLQYGRAIAIFLTFFFSALLHGMNIEIGLVLLSLGGFSYIQSMSQRMLSDVISACVKIRPCMNCMHRFKSYHPLTMLINFIFMLLNVLHLAYLGSVMDAISVQQSFYDTFLKWEILDLTSHHIFVVILAVCCIFGNFLEE